MGYNSSYLGSNVDSNYLQYDNLRMDVITGKTFDSGGTKYLQSSHDGTNGYLTVSSGYLYIKAAGTIYLWDATGAANAFRIESAATRSTLYTGAGDISLRPFTGVVYVGQNSTLSRLQVYAANNTDYGYISPTAVVFSGSVARIASAGNIVRFSDQDGTGTPSGKSILKLYDAGAAAWVNLSIVSGTLTQEAG